MLTLLALASLYGAVAAFREGRQLPKPSVCPPIPLYRVCNQTVISETFCCLYVYDGLWHNTSLTSPGMTLPGGNTTIGTSQGLRTADLQTLLLANLQPYLPTEEEKEAEREYYERKRVEHQRWREEYAQKMNDKERQTAYRAALEKEEEDREAKRCDKTDTCSISNADSIEGLGDMNIEAFWLQFMGLTWAPLFHTMSLAERRAGGTMCWVEHR